MDHVMLLVKESEAHDIFYELGKKGVMQLIDVSLPVHAHSTSFHISFKLTQIPLVLPPSSPVKLAADGV